MANERLVVLNGALEGQAFDLNACITIGRNPGNTIQLDDLQVSREHAVIERTPNGVLLRDLGSGNGTWIGDQRILEYRPKNADIIRIGTRELRFEAEETIAAPPVPPPPEKPAQAVKRPDSGIRQPEKEGVRIAAEEEESFHATDARTLFHTFFEAPDVTADEKLKAAQQRLQALYKANQIISSEQNLNRLFARVMEQIFDLVPAHNGVILLPDEENGELRIEYVKSGSGEDVVISSQIVNRAWLNGEAVITQNAADDDRFAAGQSIIVQNISSAMSVPLIHQDNRLGVVYVDTRGTTNAFVNSDLELLVALAAPAAIAIRNAQYLKEVEDAYDDTLVVLANAIELRDHYTVGHTWRVTHFSLSMARELSWSEEKLKEVEMGVVLHDVGKIAVDNAILSKPGRLTDEEYEKMKIHPQRGQDLLDDVERLRPLIPYCLYHHERVDGKGYPFGLEGDNIPIEGRLVAVADTFDAMTSNRPYRKGLDPDVAISEIEKGKGTQFDPLCAEALVNCYRNGKIDSILQANYEKHERSIVCPFCSTSILLPEDARQDSFFECHVCRRAVKVHIENDTWFGELMPRAPQLAQESEKGDNTSR
jgi:HD-GYP domain-containing protein (c-di-GMP phosphodiesterase class II)